MLNRWLLKTKKSPETTQVVDEIGMNRKNRNQRIAKCKRCHRRHDDTLSEPDAQLSDEKTSEAEDEIADNAEYVTEHDVDKEEFEDIENLPSLRTHQTARAMQNPQIPKLRQTKAVANEPLAVYTLTAFQRAKNFQKVNHLSEIRYIEEVQKVLAEYVYGTDVALENIDEMVEKLTGSKTRRGMALMRNHHWRSVQPEDYDNEETAETQELEPCGMMTTITQLDCGCRQKSKKPIFTTRSADIREYRCYRTTPGSHNELHTTEDSNRHHAQLHNNLTGPKNASALTEPMISRKNSPKHLPTFNTDLLLNMKDPVLQAAKAKIEQNSRRRHTLPITKYNHTSTNTP